MDEGNSSRGTRGWLGVGGPGPRRLFQRLFVGPDVEHRLNLRAMLEGLAQDADRLDGAFVPAPTQRLQGASSAASALP